MKHFHSQKSVKNGTPNEENVKAKQTTADVSAGEPRPLEEGIITNPADAERELRQTTASPST